MSFNKLKAGTLEFDFSVMVSLELIKVWSSMSLFSLTETVENADTQ